MLFYINIGLLLFILLNFKTCIGYLVRYYILCELYLQEFMYRNKQTVTYYSTTTFNKNDTYQDIEPTMLVKIEYKDQIKYLISSREIKKEEIEKIIICPKLFLAVELSYNSKLIDLTKETNMIVYNSEIEFNNKTAQILLFIKENSNKNPLNSIILWNIITNDDEMYTTNYIKFKIKEDKLLEYKE